MKRRIKYQIGGGTNLGYYTTIRKEYKIVTTWTPFLSLVENGKLTLRT